MLLVTIRKHRISAKDFVPIEPSTWIDLTKSLASFQLDTLICGGIDQESKKALQLSRVDIIDNVASDIDSVLHALEMDALHPGFGFEGAVKRAVQEGQRASFIVSPHSDNRLACVDRRTSDSEIDCIECGNRVCLHGKTCPRLESLPVQTVDTGTRTMLEAAADISLERERNLCRISELVYFCLEMDFHRIGLAFCADLLEPAEILSQLLRRYFDVFPVICKAGGISRKDPFSEERGEGDKIKFGHTSCNPLGQARILNNLNTDLNVMVGLCMGVDCVFTKSSVAPVTTLFVKDKSLANNPIGALYSEYYLKEVTQTNVKAT
jgi:uncharacterized metal-binding protein